MAINQAPLPNGIQLVNTGLTPNDRQGDPLPVAFEKINHNFRLVITKNEDQFPGPVTFQQTVVVMGQTTFNQATTFNQSATANAQFRFNAHVDFRSTATFDAGVVFNNSVSYNRVVTFEDDVTFNDPVTFTDIVTMQGPVNLPDGVIKPSNLDAINTPANDLFLGYNQANGRFAWRPAPAGGGGGDGNAGPYSIGIENINAPGAAANRFLRINPQGNGLIWSDVGQGGLVMVNLGDINAPGAAPTRVLSVAPDGTSLLWVDVAQQQAITYQNIQQMILTQSEAIRTAGRNASLVQNQLGLRVYNYQLPLGVAANVEGESDTEDSTSLDTESPLPLSIVSLPLPSATAGRSYRARLEVNNGKGPFYWSLMGTVPGDLDLPPVTARGFNFLSGTVPAAGTYVFTVEVRDSSTPPMVASHNVTLQVDPAPPNLTILTDRLPNVMEGNQVEIRLEAINGGSTYTWALTAGTLPTGLTLDTTSNRATTTISGVPTVNGTFQFTVSVTSNNNTSSRTYELRVLPAEIPPLEILTQSPLNTALRNRAYETLIQVQGGKKPYYFQVSQGQLPAGLSFSDNFTPFPQTRIFGTPTTAGENTFTIQVTDSSPQPKVVSRQFTLAVENVPSSLRILTQSLPVIYKDMGAIVRIDTAAGEGPYTWSVTSGNLPPGIQLHGGNAAFTFLRGVPTQTGDYSFTLQVSDSSGASAQVNYTLRVRAAIAELNQTSASTPLTLIAYQGVPFRFGVFFPHSLPNWRPHHYWIYTYINNQYRYGSAPYNGLSLSKPGDSYQRTTFSGPDFYISGTPQNPGTYRYAFQVWKYAGNYYRSEYLGWRYLDIVVLPTASSVFLTTTLPLFYIGSTTLAEIVVSGNTVSWVNISGLPSWITYEIRGNVLRLYGVVPSNLAAGTVYILGTQVTVDGQTYLNYYPIYILQP